MKKNDGIANLGEPFITGYVYNAYVTVWKNLLFNSTPTSLDGTKSPSNSWSQDTVIKPTALGFMMSMFH